MTRPGIVSIKQRMVIASTNIFIQWYIVSCLDNCSLSLTGMPASSFLSSVFMLLNTTYIRSFCNSGIFWFLLTAGSSSNIWFGVQNHMLHNLTSPHFIFISTLNLGMFMLWIWNLSYSTLYNIFFLMNRTLSPQLYMNFLERNYRVLFFCKNIPIECICVVSLIQKVPKKSFLTVLRW